MPGENVTIDGRQISLTNLDKILYPSSKFTKAKVIEYYARVADYLLPHLKDRPVTLKRYPDGVNEEFFYEKNAPKFTPDWIERFSVRRHHHAGDIQYILINNLPTLIWVANIASIELHPFLHRAPRISVPTEIAFDFDPGEGTNILTCARAALLMRDVLSNLGLNSFPKVSGSKGLQVYIPLNGDLGYEIIKPLTKTMAELMEEQHPELIVSKMSKSLRAGKVFIDWSQNTETKTTVSVYSLRAKSGGPFVSMPMTWAELTKAVRAKDPQRLFFEPERALKLLKKAGDLFATVEEMKQTLPSELLNALEHSSATSKPLELYRQKRNFLKTSEPEPLIPRRSAQGSTRRFVIQKHAATHLHYDFRLEMHGVLKSWAVPKGPPLSADAKRLAMPTEDHPLEYLSFEGTIPTDQYGGGTVMGWDIGTYELIEGNYFKGKLKVYLHGKKLQGEWTLAKSRENGDRPKWFLMKTGQETIHKITSAERSALSGRTMDQIAKNPEQQWQSNRAGRPRTASARFTKTQQAH